MAKSGEMGFTGGSSIWVADCCGVVGSANPETDRTCQVQEIKFGRGKGFGPRWVEAIGECACMWVCAWQCSQGAVDKPRQADCAPRVVSSKSSAGKRPQSPSAFLAITCEECAVDETETFEILLRNLKQAKQNK